MSITATFEDGKIVLPPGVTWPNGATLRIDLVEDKESADKRPTVWEVLKKYDGVATDLPPDLAENHDHYLYGHPKKEK